MTQIYDTTLRDGTQRKDISLSCTDKIRIAQRLDEMGRLVREFYYIGPAWYERSVDIPPTWQGRQVHLCGELCSPGNEKIDVPCS